MSNLVQSRRLPLKQQLAGLVGGGRGEGKGTGKEEEKIKEHQSTRVGNSRFTIVSMQNTVCFYIIIY